MKRKARRPLDGRRKQRKRRLFAARAVAGLFFFLVIVGSLAYHAARNNRSDYLSLSRVEWDQLPQPTNPDLGRPLIVSITVDRGATVRWQAPQHEEMLGFNLYRFKGDGGPGERVNSALILDQYYFDDEGTVFNLYTVAAVDRRGLEGPASEAVAAVEEPTTLAGLRPTSPPEVLRDVTFSAAAAPELPPEIRDCTSPGMAYRGTWYLEHYPEVYGGGLMVTPYAGDSLTYTFEGSGFSIISVRHWNYGIMDVYVDGERKGSVDLYSDHAEAQARVFTLEGLTPGVHTLQLECTGQKNPAANFTFIAVDAVEVK